MIVMKNKFLVLLVAAFISILSVNAQSKKDLKKNKVKSFHQVHTSVENNKETTVDALVQKFDNDGNVTEEINYDKEGKVKSHFTAVYDKNGDKTEEQVFEEDGKLKKKKTYKYNAKGDRTEEYHNDPSGKLIEKIIFSYNANGDKVAEVTMDPSNNPTEKTFY